MFTTSPTRSEPVVAGVSVEPAAVSLGGNIAGLASVGFTASETALGAVVSRLEDIERRARALEAERLEALAAAFDIAAADGERAEASHPTGKAGELAYRSVRAEVAAALHMSERTAERHIAHAYTVTSSYPLTLGALRNGHISPRHVQVIADAGHVIGGGDDAGTLIRRAEYEAHVAEVAACETAARLAPLAKRIAEEYAEVSLDERYEAAVKQRRVWVEDREDGMADLIAHLPAVEARSIYRRLTRTAKKMQRENGERPGPRFVTAEDIIASGRPGDAGGAAPPPRCRDEIRADLLADLLSEATFALESLGAIADRGFSGDRVAGASTTVLGVEVQIITTADRLGISTPLLAGKPPGSPPSRAAAPPPPPPPVDLHGITHRHPPPAMLDGHGPIPDAVARAYVAQATHFETVTASGGVGASSAVASSAAASSAVARSAGAGTDAYGTRVLSVDRYRPSEQIRRFLAARDRHCRFPGCRVPATDCDIDHTVDAALGGPTHTANLAHLCRGHHTLKHHTGWRVEQQPGGVMRWTSPTGRTHVDRPTPQIAPQELVPF